MSEFDVAGNPEEKTRIRRSNLVEVSGPLFRAAYRFASTKEVRLYINGVRIEKHPDGGVLLIATDGHRLIVIRDVNGWCKKAVTIQLEKAGREACRHTKVFTAPRLIVEPNGTARISEYTSPKSAVLAGDEYPEWRNVVPVQKWQNAPSSFNGGYLGDFGKVSQDLGSPSGSIRVICGTSDSAALVLFPDSSDAFGILMPMRTDVPSVGLPAWMKPVMEAKPKAKAKAKAKAKP